jgi:hypothetical protein
MTTPNKTPSLYGIVDLRVYKMLSDIKGAAPTYDEVGIDIPGATALSMGNGSSTVEGKGDERIMEVEYKDDKSDVGFNCLYCPMDAMAMINSGEVDTTSDTEAAIYHGPGPDDTGEYFRVEALTKDRKKKFIIWKVKGRLFPDGLKGSEFNGPSFKGDAIHTTGNVYNGKPRRFALAQANYQYTLGGAMQVETATVAGTVTTAGNATVTVTAAGLSGSPKAISVPVALNDSAAVVAQKIREGLQLDAAVTAMFTVSGTGVLVTLTAKTPIANDATMNIAIANGTCAGLTAAPTSTDTTAGQVPN